MPCTVLQRYVATRLVALIMLRHDFESCKGNSFNLIKNIYVRFTLINSLLVNKMLIKPAYFCDLRALLHL